MAETLDSPRTVERDLWFKGYFPERLRLLLASIVDSAYRLDIVLSAPSPAGVSVVEYNILRPMLEYTYKLFNLVQVEIGIHDREQRAIEDWYSDRKQLSRISTEHQRPEDREYFTKWEPILTHWYAELTGAQQIREVTLVRVMNRFGKPDDGWDCELGNRSENPAYRSGYSIYSAIEHCNLWAVRRYAMNDSQNTPLNRNGLDDKTLLQIQDIAGTLLQCSYASFTQFAHIGAGGAMMNKLGQHLVAIRSMLYEKDGACK